MVLSMAAITNAGLVFQASKTEVCPGDVITVDLVTTSGTPGVTGFAIDAITDGALGGVASGPLTLNSGFNTYQKPGTVWNTGGVEVVAIAGASSGANVSGTLWSFQYHVPDVPESTMITIKIFEDDQDYLAPSYTLSGGTHYEGTDFFTPLVLHVVPEPMTMALLGLGGLLLRRRK